jgi:uncharacterized membrane-anchored protein
MQRACGYNGSALLILVALAVVTALYLRTRVSRPILFWTAFGPDRMATGPLRYEEHERHHGEREHAGDRDVVDAHLILVALAVVTALYLRTRVSRPILFWTAFVLTRPLCCRPSSRPTRCRASGRT